MAEEGDRVAISKACHWAGISRRSYYYKERKSRPKINEHLAARVKRLIETLPYAGYRTTAWLLGENKNTIQRLFQLKGWQVRKRRSGSRPRVESLPSVASRPNERWSTDLARVWCGPIHRWCALTIVMDCHTREALGWRLSPTGNARAAEAALEEALIYRYGTHLAPLHAHCVQLRSEAGVHPTTYTAAKRDGRALDPDTKRAMPVAAYLQLAGGSQADAEEVVPLLQRTTTSSGAGDEITQHGVSTTISGLSVQIPLGHYTGAIGLMCTTSGGIATRGLPCTNRSGCCT